nr:nitroreductase family protein [Maliibacterium massiliense]
MQNELLHTIAGRRSIRAFQKMPVPHQAMEAVLAAGMAAPSSKNRQPWSFTVVTGGAKAEMCAVMRAGLAREAAQPLLPQSAVHLAGARHTLAVMEQAPVVIFVSNTLGAPLDAPLDAEARVYEICNMQSIGACLENMALAAAALGLGSLWICDTYFAQAELTDWLQPQGVLCAAMALGYAQEQPPARPRKPLKGAVRWRT